ncbi:MAG: iron chaperone [Bacteroidia bacterium]
MKSATPMRSIDEYLLPLAPDIRDVLERLRGIILQLVPDAEEVISYQIPTFKWHGSLVGFAAFKSHCSFFVMNAQMLNDYKKELVGYKYSGSTIHFTPEKPLSTALLKKLIKFRMKENKARKEAKEKGKK